MKKYRKYLFRIIFLFAILFGYGINVYSSNIIQINNTEQSTPINDIENNFLYEIDSNDEDQIDNPNNINLVANSLLQFSNSNLCFFIIESPKPIWQPPKIF